jgi:hypothetical protein
MSDAFHNPAVGPSAPRQGGLYYARKRDRAAQYAKGSIIFLSNAAQTITIGGTVITLGTDFALGATLADTLESLLAFLNASADANLGKARYSIAPGFLIITAKNPQDATLTLAASAATVSGGTVALGRGWL